MHPHHELKKFLRLDVQSAERVATPVLVAKSKKFRGALDLTYITTSSTNDDLGSAPSTLGKQGVVFGNTQRKVGRPAAVSPASRKYVPCTRIRVCLHTHACLYVHVHTYSHVRACILFTRACARLLSCAGNGRHQASAGSDVLCTAPGYGGHERCLRQDQPKILHSVFFMRNAHQADAWTNDAPIRTCTIEMECK